MMTNEERLGRLDTFRAEGRLTRKRWTGTDEAGRELACLLACLAPECGEQETASVCPAEVMPRWLAELTPWLDDAGSDAHWPAVVTRYAGLARRWGVLTPDQWVRLDYRVRGLSVREAMRHSQDAAILAACEAVATLCERASVGDMATKEDWAAASLASAARAEAASLPEALSSSAAAASAASAASAAAAALPAAWAVAAWAAASSAMASSAAAADRLIDAILDAIEEACAGGDDDCATVSDVAHHHSLPTSVHR